SFAQFQQTDPASKYYGRVPNIVNPSNIDYHTTDGTPRFVIALRDYVQYSGDTALVRQLYPAVQASIEGALKHWWAKLAEQVRQHFGQDYRQPGHDYLADRLDQQGRADFTLRPNQLFALDLVADPTFTRQVWPKLTGAYLQAWSNAEQLRVWYQYFLGIRPDVPNQQLTLAPRLPAAIQHLDYRFLLGAGSVAAQYQAGPQRVYSYTFQGIATKAEEKVERAPGGTA
nr:hypothetical protein [Tanacetum cinerariifolium]